MCEADLEPLQPSSPDAAADLEQELLLCKQFLEEAQDDVQQLQAQLAVARQSAAAAAGTNARLQGELAAAQQQRTQLQQQLAEATQKAEAQLAAANAQATTTRQQLSDAKQALVAMQKGMRELRSQQQQQAEQWDAFAAEAAGKHAEVKAQAAAAKAELRRVQAAAEQQAAVTDGELAAARTAEASARAEASRARAAHASCTCQLAEAHQELAQCREQLQALGGLRGELAALQAALTQQKLQQQQQHKVQEACAEAGRHQEHCQLQQELSTCKDALAEAQQEVARLEADSRQLEALRRSSTPNAAPTISCSSRIPLAPITARPATAAGNYCPSGANTEPGSRSTSGGGSSSMSGCSSPHRSSIPTSPSGARPQTASVTLCSSDGGSEARPLAAGLTVTPPDAPFLVPAAWCQGSARGARSDVPAGILVSPRRASMSAVGPAGFSRASGGGPLHRDLTALRRLSAHNSPSKPQGVTGVAAAAAAGPAPAAARQEAAAGARRPALRQHSSTAGCAAVPLLQALCSPRPSLTGPGRSSQ